MYMGSFSCVHLSMHGYEAMSRVLREGMVYSYSLSYGVPMGKACQTIFLQSHHFLERVIKAFRLVVHKNLRNFFAV